MTKYDLISVPVTKCNVKLDTFFHWTEQISLKIVNHLSKFYQLFKEKLCMVESFLKVLKLNSLEILGLESKQTVFVCKGQPHLVETLKGVLYNLFQKQRRSSQLVKAIPMQTNRPRWRKQILHLRRPSARTLQYFKDILFPFSVIVDFGWPAGKFATRQQGQSKEDSPLPIE